MIERAGNYRSTHLQAGLSGCFRSHIAKNGASLYDGRQFVLGKPKVIQMSLAVLTLRLIDQVESSTLGASNAPSTAQFIRQVFDVHTNHIRVGESLGIGCFQVAKGCQGERIQLRPTHGFVHGLSGKRSQRLTDNCLVILSLPTVNGRACLSVLDQHQIAARAGYAYTGDFVAVLQRIGEFLNNGKTVVAECIRIQKLQIAFPIIRMFFRLYVFDFTVPGHEHALHRGCTDVKTNQIFHMCLHSKN